MKKQLGSHDRLIRRRLMQASLGALCAPHGMNLMAAGPQADEEGPILVVLELSGGNDGLNTLVPYGDDDYYRQRPTIGIKPGRVLPIDDYFGFVYSMPAFERLFKDGNMAIFHGCGYANPSLSHFTSMAYWHTAAPNSGDSYGWVGKAADAIFPEQRPNLIVNVDSRQSLAVNSRKHIPVVFDNPESFTWSGYAQQKGLFNQTREADTSGNASKRYLLDVMRSAQDASSLVREAWLNYSTPVDYGLISLDLPKIAALINARVPARFYYTSYRNNAFDTHVGQNNVHWRLLSYTADAVAGFMRDMERIGRADDVIMLIFSEFGRRVPENTSLGTDHGTANHMYIVGSRVKGGHYGEVPSLSKLEEHDNLIYTTDFRRVYATVIDRWFGQKNSDAILDGHFEPFDVFS